MTWEATWPRRFNKFKTGLIQISSIEKSSQESKESESKCLTANTSSKPQHWPTSLSLRNSDRRKLRIILSRDYSSSRRTTITINTNITNKKRSPDKLRWESRCKQGCKATSSSPTCSLRSKAESLGRGPGRTKSQRITFKNNFKESREWIKSQRKWTNNISNR